MRAGSMAGVFAAALVSIEPVEAWTVNPTNVLNGGTAASILTWQLTPRLEAGLSPMVLLPQG
ncbi:Uncharacterised protein [Serratia fonticola]|uniref:Uncharacterized protein n=1 Tax=Serratia fonticola TaxID=47917 RepID=A0A4U9W0R4_SERFO|nr:Uncharacterised protein [Serratia fonticola]